MEAPPMVIFEDLMRLNMHALETLHAKQLDFLCHLLNKGVGSGDSKILWTTGEKDRIRPGDNFLIRTRTGVRFYDEKFNQLDGLQVIDKFPEAVEELMFMSDFFELTTGWTVLK